MSDVIYSVARGIVYLCIVFDFCNFHELKHSKWILPIGQRKNPQKGVKPTGIWYHQLIQHETCHSALHVVELNEPVSGPHSANMCCLLVCLTSYTLLHVGASLGTTYSRWRRLRTIIIAAAAAPSNKLTLLSLHSSLSAIVTFLQHQLLSLHRFFPTTAYDVIVRHASFLNEMHARTCTQYRYARVNITATCMAYMYVIHVCHTCMPYWYARVNITLCRVFLRYFWWCAAASSPFRSRHLWRLDPCAFGAQACPPPKKKCKSWRRHWFCVPICSMFTHLMTVNRVRVRYRNKHNTLFHQATYRCMIW